MTKDEILNMPAGREMDMLVGKYVMKLDVEEPFEGWYGDLIPIGDDEFVDPEGWTYDHQTKPLPNYSTNIGAAWQVVNEMSSCGYYFILDDDLCAWTAKFTNADTHKTFAVNTTKSNAAEEICRAALLAVME